MGIENRRCITPCLRKYIWCDEPFDSVELHWSIVLSLLQLPALHCHALVAAYLQPVCVLLHIYASLYISSFNIALHCCVQRQHPATFLSLCAWVDGHDESLDILLLQTHCKTDVNLFIQLTFAASDTNIPPIFALISEHCTN